MLFIDEYPAAKIYDTHLRLAEDLNGTKRPTSKVWSNMPPHTLKDGIGVREPHVSTSPKHLYRRLDGLHAQAQRNDVDERIPTRREKTLRGPSRYNEVRDTAGRFKWPVQRPLSFCFSLDLFVALSTP
jgi:hypothetical protein